MKLFKSANFILAAIAGTVLLCSCSNEDKTKQRTTIIFKGPEKMTMSYNGKELDGLRRRVSQGRYIFKFSAPGYYPMWKDYLITPGQQDMLETISLKPFHSAVYITSSAQGIDGDAHANISRNGMPQGTTPALLTGLETGRHIIKLTLPGFADFSQEVTVSSPRPLPRIDAKMLSTSGRLVVRGTPANAQLYVNGKDVGTIPWSGKVDAGRLQVELSAEGYLTKKSDVMVSAGEDKIVNIALEPRASSLRVRSEPTHAELSLDGKKLGTTPYTINNLTPGNYKVEVRHDGFEAYVETVEIKAGSSDEIFAKLRSGFGSARLTVRPAGVDIFVDGRFIKRTEEDENRPGDTKPILINNLLPGEHICTVSHPRARPPKQQFKFKVNREKITEQPVYDLWVANCILEFKDGEIARGKLLYRNDQVITFSPQPRISYSIECEKIKKITMLGTDEK